MSYAVFAWDEPIPNIGSAEYHAWLPSLLEAFAAYQDFAEKHANALIFSLPPARVGWDGNITLIKLHGTLPYGYTDERRQQLLDSLQEVTP